MPHLDTIGPNKLPITLHSGEGALLWDTGGRTYWDFYGGHAVTILGQGHPTWVAAIERQARQLSFFTQLADIAIRTKAADSVCAFTKMHTCWFVNSGAEANEAALKMARKATGRSVIVAMEKGFHGRTMGALGVTWKYREQHAPAHGTTRFVPYGDVEALKAVLTDDVAAIICEPMLGISGIVEPPAGFLKQAVDLAHANGSLFIADEIQSGMGRTGLPLETHRENLAVDIVSVGKSIGAGFPVAGVLMTEAVAKTVSPGEHGTTYGGGPLACAAVQATLEVLESEGLMAKATTLGEVMRSTLITLDGVTAVRGAGAWIGCVLDRPVRPVVDALREQGFLVGTAGDPHVLRLAPPAVMPEYAVHLLVDAMRGVLSAS
ncbi:MAG: acetylornithine aminotransferase/acetylornithine/N-succinyldiaminopimelate aminotransferase [Myxococcota bacterium]|jgi:acetylornithine aminotransferase/acetylornithine/N-succinyldiaminopimelate aminotransferase